MIDDIIDKLIPLPDEADVLEQIKEALAAKGFAVTFFGSGGIFFRLIRIVILVYIELKMLARTILKNSMLTTAEGDWVTLKALDYSKTLKTATKTSGYLTVAKTNTEEILAINRGHMFKTKADATGKELKFFALENTVIPAGTAEGAVLVEAEYAGTAYNISPGKIIVSMLYIDGTVTNKKNWIVSEGADIETIESLRTRTLNSWSELSAKATDETIKQAACKTPGVISCSIDSQHPRGQGTVDVYIVGAAGEATPELIRTVQNAVEPLKGNYDDFLVKSAIAVRQMFEIAIYIDKDSSTDGIKEIAETLITRMMQLSDRELNTLYRDTIITILKNGITTYKRSNIVSPSSDVILGKNSVIILGNMNISVFNVEEG